MRDTIDMAREAGFNLEQGFLLRITGIDEDLERFTELVRADEREACARVCDDYEVPEQILGVHPDYIEGKLMALHQAAAAIRAKGKT